MNSPDDAVLFAVLTPVGFEVRTTAGYWDIITTIKHPIMAGRQTDVRATLSQPEEVRQSTRDAQIYLFCGPDGADRWICAVARRLNGEGFLVTAYRTGKIKEGARIWPR
jgi:hypothetical protein